MACFIVTYDLVNHATEGQYKNLIDDLNLLKGHHAQGSVWLVDWPSTAQALWNRLSSHVHASDRLLVLQYFNNSTWQSRSWQGTNAWLTARCGPSS